MPVFFSIDGKLNLPDVEHPSDQDYTPIELGKLLCVEIIHLTFGKWRLGSNRSITRLILFP
jgi:hypothetical protein